MWAGPDVERDRLTRRGIRDGLAQGARAIIVCVAHHWGIVVDNCQGMGGRRPNRRSARWSAEGDSKTLASLIHAVFKNGYVDGVRGFAGVEGKIARGGSIVGACRRAPIAGLIMHGRNKGCIACARDRDGDGPAAFAPSRCRCAKLNHRRWLALAGGISGVDGLDFVCVKCAVEDFNFVDEALVGEGAAAENPYPRRHGSVVRCATRICRRGGRYVDSIDVEFHFLSGWGSPTVANGNVLPGVRGNDG